MEQENLLNENNQKELPYLPEELHTEKLTMETAGGINKLYEAYLKGQEVELPPWLVETNKEERKIEVLPQELYLYLKKNDHIKSVKLGNSRGIILYHYNKDGYYKKWTESDCKAHIKSFIPVKIRNSSQWDKVYKELITDYANTSESELNANENIINFQNGTLDLTTGKLSPHSPDDLCTIQIPCKYTPNLPLAKAPTILKFLTDLTNENTDDMWTIIEIIGLVISNVKCSRCKKLLILYGAGDTGKSKLREFVEHLVGKDENCHTIDLAQMHNKFGLGGTYGKRLIGSGDMKCSRIADIEILKQLTGGDSINMELKYENAFTTNFNGFIWFNCNELPSFGGDRGKHVYERFLILSCDNVIPKEKQDPNLPEKLYAEREVLVSVAVKALQDLIKRNYKITESTRTIQNRLKYEIQNDSLALFLKECCEIGVGRTPIPQFKYQYKRWCAENGLIPERPNDINNILVYDFKIVKGKSNGYEYYELKLK